MKSWIILLVLIGVVWASVKYGPKFYFQYFTSIYQDGDCRIEIRPSGRYENEEVIQAIGFLKGHSDEFYGKMCDYVTAIAATDECGQYATACAHAGSEIGIARIIKGIPTDKLAGLLVHETCHFHQGHTATPESYRNPKMSEDREAECYQTEDKFMEQVTGKE